ncbi:hypothetical protein [Rhizobium leguminosarum]|uniref:hypothetical protein n=1 Tax=Rhizobium leguminosarum TaxID=384 RepID=UPI003F951A02
MEQAQGFSIHFTGVSSAEKNVLAQTLMDSLSEIQGVRDPKIERERDDTQDAGTILSIVLAGPAVVLAVKAINNFIIRNNQAKLVIVDSDGHRIDASGLESGDVPKTVEAFESAIRRSHAT